MVRKLEIETCSAITAYLEKYHITSVNIENVIKEKFAVCHFSWEFVACVFVLIKNLVWKEWF